MITVATLLWGENAHSRDFSRGYSEAWVEKLYRGFRRNLTGDMRFVVFTDREYSFEESGIEQERLRDPEPSYASCIEPYRLGVPMILVGLDTVVTGNIDHLAEHCMTADRFALPRDPYRPEQACNGVALVPAGYEHIASDHRGENDMEHVRRYAHDFIDDLFPGHVQSFKGSVKARGLNDARIVYFHGAEKPHELPARHPIMEHWI